jgi:hypothetical protein
MLRLVPKEQTPGISKPYPKITKRVGKKKEFHFNFKWQSHPCSSANIVEFFVLIVHDFYRRKYEVRTFGPYDFSPVSYTTEDFKELGGKKKGDKQKYESMEDMKRFNTLRWLAPLSSPVAVAPPGAAATAPLRQYERYRSKLTPSSNGFARTGYIQNPFYLPSPIPPICRRQTVPRPTCEYKPGKPGTPAIPAVIGTPGTPGTPGTSATTGAPGTPAIPPTPATCEEKYSMSCGCDKDKTALPVMTGRVADYFPQEGRGPDPKSNGPSLRFNGK